ncbi:MAG: 50S ribosomal protein L5 [Candidatus Taylorbacteria bacterium]|nr:50S ribosomal protein L5 [Candidatus Taylorbacteria bacterium]
MKTIKQKQTEAYVALKEKFGLTNPMQTPVVEKVIVSSGIGSTKDKKKVELIADRLAKITGQRPSTRVSKKSIASFKVREGEPVGYMITLRGGRMFDFLDRLINIALPRTKDFRGIPRKSIDAMGNYTLGIKEHTIFPETSDEDLKDVFGMSITVVTSSKDKKLTEAYMEFIGFPFKKTDVANEITLPTHKPEKPAKKEKK